MIGVKSMQESKSVLRMIPRSLLTNSDPASALISQREAAKDKFLCSGLKRDDSSA